MGGFFSDSPCCPRGPNPGGGHRGTRSRGAPKHRANCVGLDDAGVQFKREHASGHEESFVAERSCGCVMSHVKGCPANQHIPSAQLFRFYLREGEVQVDARVYVLSQKVSHLYQVQAMCADGRACLPDFKGDRTYSQAIAAVDPNLKS